MVTAYDFLDLSDLQINEFLCNWLHSAASVTHVRRLFSSIKLDDEIQTIIFEVKNPMDKEDDESDKEWIIEILAMGTGINWLRPKVLSMESIAQTYGTSEAKFYSESQHLKEKRSLLDGWIASQKKEVADHSATWNSYLMEAT